MVRPLRSARRLRNYARFGRRGFRTAGSTGATPPQRHWNSRFSVNECGPQPSRTKAAQQKCSNTVSVRCCERGWQHSPQSALNGAKNEHPPHCWPSLYIFRTAGAVGHSDSYSLRDAGLEKPSVWMTSVFNLAADGRAPQ